MTEARFPGSIRLVEAAAPGTPPTGTVYVYVKADGILYFKDDAGTETACGGAGGPATQLDANGTTLDVDAIADGEFLVRSGTTIISSAGGGGGLSEAEVLGRLCAAGVF